MSRASDVERVFLIADLSGYTALTEAHGNLEAAKVVARYLDLARERLEPGVSIVERVGDELLMVSQTAVPMARTATRLRDAVEAEPLFPRLRSGLHAGRVLDQDGRFIGAALNVTARVAQYARPGQVLCTSVVAEALRDDPRLACRPLGPQRFKNLSAPIEIFEISGDAGPTPGHAVDPVCRMQVDAESAPARLPWQGRAWYFCSLECARAFAGQPEAYT